MTKEKEKKFLASLSSILTLLKINLNNMENLFIKEYITAIENIRFGMYLRFNLIQTQFIFSRWLLVEHHTSLCRIFSSRSVRSRLRKNSAFINFKGFCLLLS